MTPIVLLGLKPAGLTRDQAAALAGLFEAPTATEAGVAAVEPAAAAAPDRPGGNIVGGKADPLAWTFGLAVGSAGLLLTVLRVLPAANS